MKQLFTTLLAVLLIYIPHSYAGELKPWNGSSTQSLVLKDTQGKLHDLNQYKGKVVLVNFWATWCVPCRKEMPSMQNLKDKLTGKPFDILAVDFGESEEAVNAFLKKINIKFTVLIDKDGKAVKQWNVIGFPSSFIIDPKGKIRYNITGELVWDDPKVIEQISKLFL